MIDYNRDLVIAKAKQSFPDEALEEILEILDLYGQERHEREKERVQVAVLKLAQGRIEKLRASLAAAKTDYRDVLAWAEYPEEVRRDTWKMEDQEVKQIRERDRKQYIDWLNQKP